MKKLILFIGMILILNSCSLFITYKGKEAIDICQKSIISVLQGSVLDAANKYATEFPNKKLEWKAEKTEDNDLYIVSFADPEGWGMRWEVDIDQKVVKNIGESDYLSRKYDLSRLDTNEEFKIFNCDQNVLKLENQGYYQNSSKIIYVISGSVINRTDKIITSATLEGKLMLIFKDKTIKGEGNYESGFITSISENNPWKPNTVQHFSIKTNGIDSLYLRYMPEYIEFDISLKAKDPIGYVYNKDIADIDVRIQWLNLRGNKAHQKQSSYQETNTTNSQNSDSCKYPEASMRILTSRDVINLTKSELKLMRNEIYARHGYIFKTTELVDYFKSQTWYKPLYDDVTSSLTLIEKKNIEFILKCE
jgi:hypothetical protein